MAPNTKPVGFRLLERITGVPLSFKSYQAIVLVLTFFAYASYHATRKTMSIVKSVLDPEQKIASVTHWSDSLYLKITGHEPDSRNGWAPFDAADGTAMLGNIDVAFLSLYAFGMYVAGHLGDRVDLRNFLTIGMVGTAFFTAVFGAAYWLNIHSFYYFICVQMVAGLFQSTGWPSVVAVMGNWFGKSKRGLIMGIWNAHTSVGNISGSLIAAAVLRYGWGWSFAVPGAMIAVMGLMVFFFLPVSPDMVGVGEMDDSEFVEKNELSEPLLERGESSEEKAVGFIQAWQIPGVAPFALCLFFSKLVAYTFLYWLPFYISHTGSNQYIKPFILFSLHVHYSCIALL
jgi:MFS transporter, OPA family, solute carrier family 37 (glycerol-3-phosphate transporter), member 1/2